MTHPGRRLDEAIARTGTATAFVSVDDNDDGGGRVAAVGRGPARHAALPTRLPPRRRRRYSPL